MIKEKFLNKKVLYWIIFILYSILNLILMLYHEPWRDEIHAWLMAKELSVPELIVASRFDGHPILWHLILMPFAKIGFPIITLNIISYIIVLISVWFILFKTNLSLFFKSIVVFTIPFTYVFSAISRNYCLILLLLTIISHIYDKKSDRPILYSILIALLVHTHSLAWGIVAGLTVTFHFKEIILYFKDKTNSSDIKKIIVGLSIIVISTILVVLELYGTTNSDYSVGVNSYIIHCIKIMIAIILSSLIFTLLNKSNYDEFFILTCSFVFQILVYTCFYSSILFQRFILIFVIFLFYLTILSKTKLAKRKLDLFCIVYLIFMCIFASEDFISEILTDINCPYSSAIEMAEYINQNLPENTTVLIDASIIGQSIIPYLDTANFYDIAYQEYVDCANVSHDRVKILNALNTLDSSYSGHYLIVCNDFVNLDFKIVYQTQTPIINEKFTLYYIP